MKKNNFKNQKGISIYLALLMIAIFLNLSLGLSFILFGEILMTRDIDHSIIAFYAADTGIEMILYKDNVECFASPCPEYCTDNCQGLNPYAVSDQALGEARYDASFATSEVSGTIRRIATSTGYYQKTTRSLSGEY